MKNFVRIANKIHNYFHEWIYEYPYIKIVTEDYRKCFKCPYVIDDDEGLYCKYRFCVLNNKNKRK